MLNWIWLALILISIAYASFVPDRMEAVGAAVLDGASSSITLVIGLVGAMVFFLGLTRIAFEGGLREGFARVLTPITRRMFPDVPPDHPAMGAMIMNMSSNMMGLGNAATPFGLKAMGELARLSTTPGVATNAMVLFLAINTSAITIFPPIGTVAVRQAAGSADPWAIWGPTLIATTCSTLCAVLAFYALGRLPVFRKPAVARSQAEALTPDVDSLALDDEDAAQAVEGSIGDALPAPSERRNPSATGLVIAGAFGLAMLAGIGQEVHRLAPEVGALGTIKVLVRQWLLPLLIGGLLLIGLLGRVRVYDSMIEGGKEGLQVAVRIVPYLVAILTAVAMFRASGLLDLIIGLIDPYTSSIGVPAEVLPMALLRPLSGSGAFAVMSEIITTHGPDSFIGYLTCTLMGSTETTFYVLALYLGAAGVVDGRHALAACLIGDVGGFVGAVLGCHWFFGA